LQLALSPFGVWSLAVLRSGFSIDGENLLIAFVRVTPTLRWGAAETHNRYAAGSKTEDR
jgi:hypothetical protein